MQRKGSGTSTARRKAARRRPPRWCCAYCCSSTCANWSFATLEREVRMNLAYRDFTRIGMGKVPDAKTLARIAQALGGEGIAELHRRLVEIAQEESVIQGRKLRVDTTVCGNQHSLPHRFKPAGRWGAGADAYDEEDRNASGPTAA